MHGFGLSRRWWRHRAHCGPQNGAERTMEGLIVPPCLRTAPNCALIASVISWKSKCWRSSCRHQWRMGKEEMHLWLVQLHGLLPGVVERSWKRQLYDNYTTLFRHCPWALCHQANCQLGELSTKNRMHLTRHGGGGSCALTPAYKTADTDKHFQMCWSVQLITA